MAGTRLGGGVAAGGRDHRLDMFRGIALVMIFINHVPGTIYENLTSRNFGFSDAAEAFVFMSGMAAGLAYSNRFRTGSIWLAMTRVWARARQLYFVHLSITMLSLAVFAAAALWFDRAQLLNQNNLASLFSRPLSAMIGIPLLTHQLGYLNILPLYTVLLLATPLLLVIGLRRPWLLLGASILLWAAAGQFRLNFPNFPTPGGWFFNPFSWQLLFVIGLLAGAAMKQGERFFALSRPLFWAALGFLVLALLWGKIAAVGAAGGSVLRLLQQAGVPFYFTAFDKTFLTLPRLLHALALFYVLGSLTFLSTLAANAMAAPLRLLGRQGLAVFAFGTVLSMALQALKSGTTPDPLVDGVLLGSGIAAMLGLAWVLSRTAEMRAAARA
ncbi:hypothetical protein VW29_05865 [Devosia limi DSM 17137]|nr:hypothetical protein VW29_05865 [Devosia limi DSM 17137]